MPVDPTSTRPLGGTGLRLPPPGFGAAPIGGLFDAVEEDAARAVLEAAWDRDLRHFDTAPWCGLGLSEHRTGAFLRGRPRGEFRVTTKVGRFLTRPADPDRHDRGSWTGGLNFQVNFDYAMTASRGPTSSRSSVVRFPRWRRSSSMTSTTSTTTPPRSAAICAT